MKNRSAFAAIALIAGLALSFGCGDDSSPSGPSTPSNGILVIDGNDQTFVPGNIKSNTTWTSDKQYVLRGAVFVEEGATLTIQAGTTILGESSSTPPGTLIIMQGAKIMANGTKDDPIVFTSDQPVGERARGQWGGLIINGKAPLNTGQTAEGEGDTGTYGGNDPTDDSGVLRYVRVEFAGQEFSPDNELNGIAFQGVGNGTTVEYIQVHYNQDDGIELFGGTVSAKYVLCTGIRDDSFDWTDGWSGKGQFWIAHQEGDDADNGFEGDNNGDNNDLTPRSNPTIYNVTLIGDPDGPESDTGMLLREGMAGTIRNAIVTGFNLTGLDIDQETTADEIDDGNLTVRSCIFWANRDGVGGDTLNFSGDTDNFDGDEADDFDEAAWALSEGTNNFEIDPMLMDPFNKLAPDFKPTGASPAVDGTVPVAAPPADGFFESVDFIGGMDPAADWTVGWTTTASD